MQHTATALAAGLALFLALTLARMEATLGAVLDSLARPAQAVHLLMTTITRTHTDANGTVHTMTWTQQAGETDEAFLARVNRAWAAYLRSIGA